jgi:N-acetyl-anhydromuramyl-L-alanine amidase AmpD
MMLIEMQIDSTTYEIKEVNRYKTQTVKTQIVLATSLRKGNYHITRLLHKEYGKTKRWNTYTVGRDGTVYQHYDSKFHSDFLGIKEADKQSISIVMENMGCLFQTPTGKHINWLNEICEEEHVIEKNWLGYSFWEEFPDTQLEGVAALCRELCEKYSIPKVCIDFHHYHKDIIRFRGIAFRSNYIEDSSDINPLFDIPKFTEMLRNN